MSPFKKVPSVVDLEVPFIDLVSDDDDEDLERPPRPRRPILIDLVSDEEMEVPPRPQRPILIDLVSDDDEDMERPPRRPVREEDGYTTDSSGDEEDGYTTDSSGGAGRDDERQDLRGPCITASLNRVIQPGPAPGPSAGPAPLLSLLSSSDSESDMDWGPLPQVWRKLFIILLFILLLTTKFTA